MSRVAELLAHQGGGRELLARNLAINEAPAVCRGLLRAGFDQRFVSPVGMVECCKLAVACAESWRRRASSGIGWDLMAEATAALGNAWRVASRLRVADATLARSEDFERRGTGAPDLTARRLEFLGSLRTRQARFPEALDALDRALAIREVQGDRDALTVAEIQRATVVAEAGSPLSALEDLAGIIARIDILQSSRLGLIARHNAIRCMLDIGRPSDALEVYHLVERIYALVDEPWVTAQQRWLRAQILAGFGTSLDLEAAVALLRLALAEFVDGNLYYQAATVGVEIAEVLGRLGREAELHEVARQILPILQVLGIIREGLAVEQLQRSGRRSARAVMARARIALQARA